MLCSPVCRSQTLAVTKPGLVARHSSQRCGLSVLDEFRSKRLQQILYLATSLMYQIYQR